MTLLLMLVEYLVAKGVCEGDGTDCFRDFVPESPDNVVVFREYSSDMFNPYAAHFHRSVQVLVRNKDAAAARAKAVRVYEQFVSPFEDLRIDFSDTDWGQVYLRQTPFKLGQDESDRIIYCFNLGITTTTIE